MEIISWIVSSISMIVLTVSIIALVKPLPKIGLSTRTRTVLLFLAYSVVLGIAHRFGEVKEEDRAAAIVGFLAFLVAAYSLYAMLRRADAKPLPLLPTPKRALIVFGVAVILLIGTYADHTPRTRTCDRDDLNCWANHPQKMAEVRKSCSDQLYGLTLRDQQWARAKGGEVQLRRHDWFDDEKTIISFVGQGVRKNGQYIDTPPFSCRYRPSDNVVRFHPYQYR